MRSMSSQSVHSGFRIAFILAAAGLCSTASAPPTAAEPQGVSGAGESLITIQYPGGVRETATAVVDFYSYWSGPDSPPVSIAIPGLSTGPGEHLYLPARPELTAGAYGAHLSSDAPVLSTARLQWPSSGGVASYPAIVGSTAQILPYFVSGADDQVSLISIQSLDTTASIEATLEVYSAEGGVPTLSMTYTVPPGSVITRDPKVHPEFLLLGDFVGWARVTADRPVTANTVVDVQSSEKGVYAFAATSEEALTSTLAAPLVLSDMPSPVDTADPTPDPEVPALHFDTWLALANPGESAAEIAFTATGLPCETAWPGSDVVEISLPAGSSTRISGAELVPDSFGCGVSVMLDSSAPIAGAVILGATDNSLWGAHSLSGSSRAPESNPTIYMPFAQTGSDAPAGGAVADSVVRRNPESHSSAIPDGRSLLAESRTGLPILGADLEAPIEALGLPPGFRSGIVVHNPGAEPVGVKLELFDAMDGAPDTACGSACEVVVESGSSVVFRLADLGIARSAFTGMIVADGPVNVTTFSDSSLGVMDITLDGGPALSGMPVGTSGASLLGITLLLKSG